MESDLGDHGPVRVVIAVVRGDPAQDVRAEDAVEVTLPGARSRLRKRSGACGEFRGQLVVERLIDGATPSMVACQAGASTLWGARRARDTAPQQVPAIQVAIQVVVGRPLEQLAVGLPEHEVVVRDGVDVARLAEVADPGSCAW